VAGPHVVLAVPEGWTEAPLPAPDPSQTSGIRVLAWKAWAPSAKGGDAGSHPGSLVAGCFGADLGTWTPEAEPFVLERLGAMVSSTAIRATGVGECRVESTVHEGGFTTQRIVGAGEAEHQLSARTFLGFVEGEHAASGRLVGCLALCASDLPHCERSVDGATVSAVFVPSPEPTLSVRAVVAMAHHPGTTLATALGGSLLLGLAAVLTRRRPRTK
jgi:hypothetical protein